MCVCVCVCECECECECEHLLVRLFQLTHIVIDDLRTKSDSVSLEVQGSSVIDHMMSHDAGKFNDMVCFTS